MSSPVSMFHDDDGAWSMTRVVAFVFALVICSSLLVMAKKDHLHDMGWPFSVLGVITLLAVPVQALCRAIAGYFESGPGRALLKAVSKQVGAVVADKVGVQPATQTINVNPPEGEQDA